MSEIKIRTLTLATLMLIFCIGEALAQQTRYSDRCMVGLIDVSGIRTSEIKTDTPPDRKLKELGTFDTVIGEEELTSRSFRLPKTKLFVVASVWYTDESMAGDDSQDSMSLQLTISPTSKRDILSGLQFADAEVLSKDFEVARVSTIYKTRRRSFYIVMECRKHTRP